jgi:hypothetical protein
VHELTWPELAPVRVHASSARWAHNVWNGEHGLVVCDSKDGCLRALRSDRVLWRPNEREVITRGLAVTPEFLYVGRSSYGTRNERVRNNGGLWMVDRKTLRTVASFVFPGSGCVNDVRVLDAPDECHVATPFDARWLELLPSRQEARQTACPEAAE